MYWVSVQHEHEHTYDYSQDVYINVIQNKHSVQDHILHKNARAHHLQPQLHMPS